MQSVDKSQVALNRLHNSGLLQEKFPSAPDASRALFGIQSQYQQFGEISLFNRVLDLTKKELQISYDQNDLIKIWGQRMTVHMYAPADWFFIHDVYADKNNWLRKHTDSLGHDLDGLLNEMEQLLLSDKKIPKEAFKELFGKHAKELMTWGGVFIQGSLDGTLFCVPESPKTRFYTHRKWINSDKQGDWGINQDKTGLETMIERYFSAYGPATINDFKHWTGLRKFEFQSILDKILVNYFSYLGEDGQIYYSKTEIQTNIQQPKPLLLGKFDPLFVSYGKKDWLANEKEVSLIWRPAGQIEAVLIVGGLFCGTWRYKITGNKVIFTFYLTKKMTKKNQLLVEKEAKNMACFLEKEYQGSLFELV